MNASTFADVDDYISQLFQHDDEILKSVEQSIRAHEMPEHSISPNQGKFLQIMAGLVQAKNILEIGTLGGYSTICLGRILPEDGKLISLEANPNFAEVARSNINKARLSHKVEIITGQALNELGKLNTTKPFDFVFIDADKPNYCNYLDEVVPLTRKGGFIIADNVIREGKVLDTNSDDEKVKGVQEFNRALASNSALESTIIQDVGRKGYDGMALARVI